MATGHIFPRRRYDQVSFIFMLIGIPFGIGFEVIVVLPVYHSSMTSPIVGLHVALTLFITANVAANMYWVITTDASGRSLGLPSVLKSGWKYCHECQLNSPPRSYHCAHCGECVLRRDHHCVFTGCCVGFRNHRYYLVAVMYLWIGAIYGVTYSWSYIWQEVGGATVANVLSLVAPHIAVVVGHLDLYTFTLMSLQAMACVLVFLTTYLFFYQVALVRSGQTAYERRHGVTMYEGTSAADNVRQLLGERWYLTWVWPSVRSRLPGDGMQFRTKPLIDELEDWKNL
ncbi:PREDICTED: probable palmitoyltransferase ZDHHC24 isoform X1 [Priapulus caudatus]|uniref:Palmitoyltransferase n=1 Tax=Priapulus caudatus TaxID=37621 RepID=A0ABM1EMK8_PRICU|nr:PREDICTED: probable palmitoyltransferase ZDHHC24 isoform X1 [Priapulus caudatus]